MNGNTGCLLTEMIMAFAAVYNVAFSTCVIMVIDLSFDSTINCNACISAAVMNKRRQR
jgi:hypothetical protein